MKYLKQFGIIMLVTLIAEGMEHLIPLPVPASIYGLLLMLLALFTGTIRLSSVKETADFLVEIMPVMFIPAAVGLLESYTALKGEAVPIVIIIVATTVIVMVVTGLVTQKLISGKKEKNKEK